MPELTIEYKTEAARLIILQAAAYADEMVQLGLSAPAKDMIGQCESFALGAGRQMLRDSLQAALAARIAELDKKGARLIPTAQACPGGRKGRGRAD